jgi:hypothetical protein
MCAPCKILLDNPGVLAASSRLLANTVGPGHALYAPAIYLAEIASGDAAGIIRAFDTGYIKPGSPEEDEAHAWSELNCHRAALIREWVDTMQIADAGEVVKVLREWAEQDRLVSTRLIGGEYHGEWIVNGVEGIERKK